MRSSLFALFTLAVLVPASAGAQALGNLGDTSSFSVSVSPQYPAPKSMATLSFVSSVLDLTNTTMTASVAGKQIYQGSVQPIAVALGKAGSVTSVLITMNSAGARTSQTVVLQPEDVSLVAEPLATTPPLYPGKAFTPLEGNSRLVAIANFADASGKTIDPATLSYTWTVDGAEIDTSSGIGKEAVIVASPIQYRLRDVSVLVQSQAGNLVGQASLSLDPKEASVRLYENDPLLGIRFEHALTDPYTIAGTEASLYAGTFSLPLMGGAPLLQWFLNGAKAQTGSIITLRPSGKGQGSASLSFTATPQPQTDSFTSASTNLTLIFGGKPSTNFFGL